MSRIIARNVSPMESAVISVGSIHGGSNMSSNVMPSEVEVTGTMRCFSKETQAILDRRMTELAHAMAAANGCTAEVELRWGTTPMVNHADQTDVAVTAANALVGAANVNPNAPAITGGEDFCFMLEAKQGAFIFIGNGVNEGGKTHQVHTPHYNFNDDIIPLGVAWWVNIVREELKLG